MRNRIALPFSALLLPLLLFHPSAHAQQSAGPAGEVRGIITGAEAQPLGASAVALYPAGDSVLVAGTLTDNAGRFRIQGLRPGEYRLRVTFVGHETVTQNVAVRPGALQVDVGAIRMTTAAVTLDALEASAQRGVVSLQVDRTVYNARQAGTAGGNATDVLRHVPGVEVDVDGSVSLRGSSNVAVQLNGRAAPLRGDALTNFLKQLPASALDRVEVVSNPSAKYDPEGMGGIINIVLRQDTQLGLSGGVNVAAGTGHKYNGSGNLGYQAGRLTLFGTVGVNDDERTNETYTFRENAFTSTRSFMEQQAHGELGQRGLMFNGSAEVKLSGTSTLSSALMVNRVAVALDTRNDYRTFDADRVLLGVAERSSGLEHSILMSDASLAFRRSAGPASEFVSEVRYNRGADDLTSSFFDGAHVNAGRTLYQSREVANATDELTLQTDVTRRIRGVTLQLGQKATLRMLDNDEAVQQPGSHTRVNEFSYDERILAAYGVLSREVGRASLQAGLRAEHTSTEFGIAAAESYDDDYVSMFPSAAALFSLSDTRKLRLGYTRRIQRPQSRFLSPFAMSDDPLNQFVGNPRLGPEYTDALELSFQQSGPRGSLQVQPFLRRTTDAIRVIKSVDESGMATTTFRNLATATSYGTDATATARVGTRLNGMLSISGFRMTTDPGVAADAPSSDALTWNARMNVSWSITPKSTAQWLIFHRAPVNVEGGRIQAYTVSTFALQQKVLGDRGSLALRVTDPLDAMKLRFSTADAVHSQTSWRKVESRILHLSFGYSFGQQPRLRQRTPQQQEDPLQVRIQ